VDDIFQKFIRLIYQIKKWR